MKLTKNASFIRKVAKIKAYQGNDSLFRNVKELIPNIPVKSFGLRYKETAFTPQRNSQNSGFVEKFAVYSLCTILENDILLPTQDVTWNTLVTERGHVMQIAQAIQLQFDTFLEEHNIIPVHKHTSSYIFEHKMANKDGETSYVKGEDFFDVVNSYIKNFDITQINTTFLEYTYGEVENNGEFEQGVNGGCYIAEVVDEKGNSVCLKLYKSYTLSGKELAKDLAEQIECEFEVMYMRLSEERLLESVLFPYFDEDFNNFNEFNVKTVATAEQKAEFDVVFGCNDDENIDTPF